MAASRKSNTVKSMNWLTNNALSKPPKNKQVEKIKKVDKYKNHNERS